MATYDLFGDRAREYARSRPGYPESLFDHLERLAPARSLAWDCGAGSGQSSRSLALRFERVVATDMSLRQLTVQAALAGNVHRVASASEAAPLRPHVADLVIASAAIHWFDRPRFYEEVRRVARPGAILAVWSYYQAHIDPAVDAVMMRYADEVVGALWTPGMQLNREGYRGLEMPFERLPWPRFEAEARMGLDDLCEFMRTWSASQAWEREHGANPVDQVRADLERTWGVRDAERLVRWPLHGVIARVA